MEVLNYTPLSRERLDIIYQKKKRHPLMDLFLIILSIITVSVLCVVFVMVYKRNIQPASQVKFAPTHVPTPSPTMTPEPSDTPTPFPTATPFPIGTQSAILFNGSSSGTLIPSQ